MAFPSSLTYSTVLTFLALFTSLVIASPIQNDEARHDEGVAGFPLHTVHLIPDAGPSFRPHHGNHGFHGPVKARQDSAVAGFPLHTVHLTPASESTSPPASTIQLTPDPSYAGPAVTGSPLFTIHLNEVNDQPTVTTTPATESGVPGYPQHTVHLTPASDSPSPQPSTISLTHSSASIFPGFPTSIPESEATMVFSTEAAEGVVATTSSACTTSITRLPSAVSGPTKIVYASTTTFAVLYPCGTCAMEIVDPPAPTPAPTFTTTVTVQGVSTYATAICTNFPWLDGMNGSQPAHRHLHHPSHLAARNEEAMDNAEEPMNQEEESAGKEEEPACKTTLYVDQPFETGIVKTVWTTTKTITYVVHCNGCQLTVINPNGVGPEIFYTSLETVKGTSTTTTRICKPTSAVDGYLGPFDLWF